MTSRHHDRELQQALPPAERTKLLEQLQALREALHRLHTLIEGQEYSTSDAVHLFTAAKRPSPFTAGNARQRLIRAQRAIAGARMTMAVELGSDWERTVIEAEGLADDLGIPLALPRSTSPQTRPGERPPDPATLEQRRALVHTDGGLVEAIHRSADRIDTCLGHCRDLESLVNEWPEPALGHATEPLAATPPSADDVLPELEARFTALDAAGRSLMDAAASGARTSILLNRAIRWQEEATALRTQADRWGIDFHPPLNDSGDLRAFAQTIGPALEVLRAKLVALRADRKM